MNNEILIEERRILSENWVSNIVAAFGNPEKAAFVSPLGDDAFSRLWDLASVTKLYSLFSILSMHEKGLFDITKKVIDYSDDYPGLSDLHIYELLNFSVELCTSARIDTCRSYEEAVDLLHGARIKSNTTIYSDIGIMIVVQLLNEINHSNLFFRNYTYEILIKIGARNTRWWKDIDPGITNIENYDSEFRFIDNELKEIKTPLGTCHDPKARIIPYTGHAGIFSSAKDISVFADALFNERVIGKETLSILLSPGYDASDSAHHFGLLCNKKHADKRQSEIPFLCSDNSIAMSGYTGTYLLLDFEKKNFIFIGANRIRNRITNLPHDTGSQAYPCTKDYVFRKDVLLDLITQELK